MADSTTSSIDISAPPGVVLDVIADFEAYPDWAHQFSRVTLLSEHGDGWADHVEYVLDAGVIRDTYVLGYDWDGVTDDGTGLLTWSLVRAEHVLKGLNGSYRLQGAPGGGTSVTYSLTVDLKIPMIGMLKRKAEKVIVTTALTELQKRAESLA